MQLRRKQQPFRVVLEFRNSITRTVMVKASSRDVAERRALKRYPEAQGVVRDA